ncbi:DNA (cytosine-5-)-methyltransferase [Bacillus cereus]|uniref:DNA (cytosine-5-)-methyltransferase n=1 Tax=Bacillus cereus TaxID=1396 RepID=UPI0014440DB7|nr:DNA cytosine methyltransferase [Bacillus cereus]
MRKYRVLDLFAGGGGFSTGFLQAKYQETYFEIVRAVEIDTDACKTLENHLGPDRVIKGDITKKQVKEKIISDCKNIDIIIGGPPCQTFSLVGPARSGKKEVREALKNDPRNSLYKHFFDIVSQIKPRFVVFENVEGLISKKLEEEAISRREQLAVEAICEHLKEMGYTTKVKETQKDYSVINSADYGVPQRRKRVIIIANLHSIENEIPLKTHNVVLNKIKTLGETIEGLPVVLPEINVSKLDTLKNIDIIIENLDFCIGAFVDNLNNISRIYQNRPEINSNQFRNLLDFVNEYFNNKIVNRKRQKLKALEGFISGYNKALGSLYKSVDIPSVFTVHESRKHNIRDIVIFSLMSAGSNSAQFMNKESVHYDKLLDRLYPYDREKHKDTYVKHSFEDLSNTILAHMQKDGLKFIHPVQPRTFTPYEAALIQSFPVDYEFLGGRNSQFRQIGNAVPPLMAKKIAEAILGILVQIDCNVVK